jgi:hypothetical protein
MEAKEKIDQGGEGLLGWENRMADTIKIKTNDLQTLGQDIFGDTDAAQANSGGDVSGGGSLLGEEKREGAEHDKVIGSHRRENKSMGGRCPEGGP